MTISTYKADKELDYEFGGVGWTPPATYYAALVNGDPTAGGTPIALARIPITKNATNFPAASSRSMQNGTKWSWGSTSGQNSLGTATYVALYDDLTAGNLHEYTPLGGAGINCNDSAEVNIPAGSATFTR